MFLHGEFKDIRGNIVRIEVMTYGSRIPDIEIGAKGGAVLFDTDPVEIVSEMNDTFDPLLTHSASIRLLTRDFISGLFCENCLDAAVTITRNGECVFAGFVEPQSYSQGFNEVYDSLEVNCIDALSALQYVKYGEVGSPGIDYDERKSASGMVSFGALVSGCVSLVEAALGRSVTIRYDGSRGLGTGVASDIFNKVQVSELLFLGDSEDDVWSLRDTLAEVMRYLDLHIRQNGFVFDIFAWSTAKQGKPVEWVDISTSAHMGVTEPSRVTVSMLNASGTDTKISVGEVFNRLELTCSVKEMESLVESPLDPDLMTSPFSNRQKYMTEYISEGEGMAAAMAFLNMCEGNTTDYDGAKSNDWFMQVKDSLRWRFLGGGVDLVQTYCQGNTNQQRLPHYLAGMPGAALISFGSLRRDVDEKDNAVISKINMTDYLVVSVNGNGKDSETTAYPNAASLLSASPVAEYTGSVSGGVLSPSDEATINYIVVSGRIVLNHLNEVTCTYADRPKKTLDVINGSGGVIIDTVPSRNNKDGRFYMQQWWGASTPTSEPYEMTGEGLLPFTGDGPQLYEFTHSAIGDGTDTVSKVAALACMLIVGDKCVVETGTQGRPSDFEWRKYKKRGECLSDDEYYGQSFTIGFDPKIGDKLIGTEFPVQNNISHTMGIDAEGTAIPVRSSDKVTGKVRFIILGPVNTMWGEVTRRHPTWFRHTQWGVNTIPLMAHVSAIHIKDFEVGIYSDNGLVNNTDNCDLVYMSDTAENFINVKDDLEFRITSALTRTERQSLGINDIVAMSTPVDLYTGTGLLSIEDLSTGRTGKPEQLYVDAYYRECHKPRVSLYQSMRDEKQWVGDFNLYAHPAFPGKTFYIVEMSRHIKENFVELHLKEIDND